LPIIVKNILPALTKTLPLLLTHPGQIKYALEWLSSLNPDKNPLMDELPWIAFDARKFLERIIRKDMIVYEYGSGGSTVFFARRVRKVISTEHNKDWYGKVLDDINRKGLLNCELRLLEPAPVTSQKPSDPSDPDAYSSNDDKYRGMSFKIYASSIDNFPDAFFDIVFIDGRSRPSCFKHALKKVKERGYLILDNAEMPYYFYIHSSLDNKEWEKYDFLGLFPYIFHFSETCIWKKISSGDNKMIAENPTSSSNRM